YQAGPGTVTGLPSTVAVASGTATSGTITAVNVGNVTVRASSGSLATADTSFTVMPVPVTVSITGGPFTYNGNPHAATVTTTPSMSTGYTVSGALAQVAGTPIDYYNITHGTLALSSNYTLACTTSVQFEIKKLTVTVTPTAGQYKTYGAGDPTLVYTFAPTLITGDSFSAALACVAGTDVGFYNITQGTLALSSNYTLVFTTGVQFEIKKLTVTVTP